MIIITLDVHEDLVTLLAEAKPSAPPAAAALEAIVLELYRRRIMSSGKAAELLAMPRGDFIVYASGLGIPFFDLSEEQWQAELKASDELTKRLRTRRSLPTPAR